MNFRKFEHIDWRFIVRQLSFIFAAILIAWLGSQLQDDWGLQYFAILPLAMALTKPGFYVEAPREGETLRDFYQHIREQLIF